MEKSMLLQTMNLESQQTDENELELRIREILERSFINEFLQDEGVTDIAFDGVKLMTQHNLNGRTFYTDKTTVDEVRKIVKQIADVQRKEITNAEPILDTEIGFLRVNAVHDAVSPDGTTFSIRVSRPRLALSSVADLTPFGSQELDVLLKVLIHAKSNIIISGHTGAGKTELQKLLVGKIKDDEIIALAEDTRDSHIKALYPQKFVLSWQTLMSENRNRQIDIPTLVRTGLRNNPDWMLVSETRGKEAAGMLDSAKTGHAIITTIHADGAEDIPARLIPMIRAEASYSMMQDVLIGREISKFLKFGIYIEATMEDGKVVRRIKEIMEYTDFEDKGVIGHYLYKQGYVYNDETADYEIKEVFGQLSPETIEKLKDKKVYHELPEIFKPKKNEVK